MKAQKLRYGNIVQHYQNLITIDGFDDITVFNKNCGDIPIYEIRPVPISIDWLVKFGFKEKDQLGDDFTVEEYTFRDYILGQFEVCYNRSDACFTCNNIVGINLQEYIFVHELQNLYYILTGKDLIKL